MGKVKKVPPDSFLVKGGRWLDLGGTAACRLVTPSYRGQLNTYNLSTSSFSRCQKQRNLEAQKSK
jgi:hypothetical protein